MALKAGKQNTNVRIALLTYNKDVKRFEGKMVDDGLLCFFCGFAFGWV